MFRLCSSEVDAHTEVQTFEEACGARGHRRVPASSCARPARSAEAARRGRPQRTCDQTASLGPSRAPWASSNPWRRCRGRAHRSRRRYHPICTGCGRSQPSSAVSAAAAPRPCMAADAIFDHVRRKRRDPRASPPCRHHQTHRSASRSDRQYAHCAPMALCQISPGSSKSGNACWPARCCCWICRQSPAVRPFAVAR